MLRLLRFFLRGAVKLVNCLNRLNFGSKSVRSILSESELILMLKNGCIRTKYETDRWEKGAIDDTAESNDRVRDV